MKPIFTTKLTKGTKKSKNLFLKKPYSLLGGLSDLGGSRAVAGKF